MEFTYGFFATRSKLALGRKRPKKGTITLMQYKNIPPVIGVIVSRKLATLVELETVYGVRDAYDLLEIAVVDAHNDQAIAAASGGF